MKKTILLLAASGILVSCDPLHFINFTNNSELEAKMKIKLKHDSQIYELRELATGDSIIFILKPEVTESINFSVGTWSDSEVNEIAGSIESLEMESGEHKASYRTQDSIKKLFKENREGGPKGWQTRIEIEIEP